MLDLKDLKAYEGTVENPDATITSDLATFVSILKREIRVDDAQAQGKVTVEGNFELVLKATTS